MHAGDVAFACTIVTCEFSPDDDLPVGLEGGGIDKATCSRAGVKGGV